MSDAEIAALEAAIADARDDPEAAEILRDRLDKLRAGVRDGPGRQRPGAMGLGTELPAHVPPKGWRPPPRPDPMTSGRKAPRGSRKP